MWLISIEKKKKSVPIKKKKKKESKVSNFETFHYIRVLPRKGKQREKQIKQHLNVKETRE